MPAADPAPAATRSRRSTRYRDHEWIVNSRNDADELAVATVAALAGFTPTVRHRSDSLELLQDMIVAGLGVGLLPQDGPTRDGVRVLPLRGPDVLLRAHAVVGRGRTGWPPLALLLRLLRDQTR